MQCRCSLSSGRRASLQQRGNAPCRPASLTVLRSRPALTLSGADRNGVAAHHRHQVRAADVDPIPISRTRRADLILPPGIPNLDLRWCHCAHTQVQAVKGEAKVAEVEVEGYTLHPVNM